MLMKYFKFTLQRATIFSGSEPIINNRLAISMKRMKPILTKNLRKTVAAMIGGSSTK